MSFTKKEIGLISVALLGGLSLGLMLGFMIANYSFIQIISSFDIENIIIDLNETQVMQAAFDHLNKTGALQ